MPSPGLRDEGENNVLSYLYIDLAIELFRAARRELNKHRLWSFRPSRRSSLCVRYTYRKRIFVRYPLAQVASIFGVCWCKIRKSSLRGCFPASRSRQRIPLLLSLSPLRKQCYSAHAGGGVTLCRPVRASVSPGAPQAWRNKRAKRCCDCRSNCSCCCCCLQRETATPRG